MAGKQLVKKKMVMLGDPAVGKTSLVRRFVEQLFSEEYITTIGTNIYHKDMLVESLGDEEYLNLSLIIWDIAGQTTLGNVKKAYFYGAQGGFVVCDVTRRDTLASVPDWIERLTATAGDLPLILLANKSDLWEDALFGEQELDEISQKLGIPWFITSARTGHEVEEAFNELAHELVRSA